MKSAAGIWYFEVVSSAWIVSTRQEEMIPLKPDRQNRLVSFSLLLFLLLQDLVALNLFTLKVVCKKWPSKNGNDKTSSDQSLCWRSDDRLYFGLLSTRGQRLLGDSARFLKRMRL